MLAQWIAWPRRSLLPVALGFCLAAQTFAAEPARAAEYGWTPPLAERLGVTLLHDLDSSGADAWDSAAHPNVFITTEGPGYGGLLSGVSTPGVAIIDSDTHEVVAHATYDVLSDFGWSDGFEPHGLGVSGDGQWIYLPTGDGRNNGRLLIINTRTLRIDKVLGTMGRPHHAKTFTTPDGRDLSYAYG